MTNVARHAHATQVEIQVIPQAGGTRLMIGANGAGFEARGDAGGRSTWGLRIMAERAEAVGALGYVLKESASDEVLEAVRVVHAGGRYQSRALTDAALDYYVRQQSGGGSRLDRLNEREREVVRLLADGQTSAEIADRLGLSPKTVDTYRSQIMHKLDIHHLPGLIKFALQHGLTSLE